jgi:hypothetical protein
MPNQATPNAGKTEKSPTLDEVHTPKTEEEAIERVADRAAERAGNREKSYDRDHEIFTK